MKLYHKDTGKMFKGSEPVTHEGRRFYVTGWKQPPPTRLLKVTIINDHGSQQVPPYSIGLEFRP